ncbi:hypothetical protein GF386_02645 [Candidatus Pacearchaeota archaeon]|nr:hypothetical protein [Candidatus Pacearchaeota archaeon]MBD3283047.1 hypothetical protein [Candidatus Pacearchaeota archaeon]
MSQKKSYFQERAPAQIRHLNLGLAYRHRGLVKRIHDLDPDEDAIEIRVQLIPGRFYRDARTGAEASRKCYKHGDLILSSHPKTQREAYDSPEIPLQIRARDFAQLEAMREEDIHFVGYSWKPVQGADRTRAIVPFREIPEGARIYSYAEQMTFHLVSEGIAKPGIKIQSYSDAQRVIHEGGTLVAEVPSRTKKMPRYRFRLMHVPMIRSDWNLASVLSLTTSESREEETNEPVKGRTLFDTYNIRYTWSTINEGSKVKFFQPQDIAAYMAVIRDERQKHNHTPLEMNPFALPSQLQKEFYLKLCNNVLVYDPTLNSRTKTRKLHLAEKSILLARAIGIFGHDEFSFWNPERDGSISSYGWRLNTN